MTPEGQVFKDDDVVIQRTIAGFRARMEAGKNSGRNDSRQIWYQGMIDYLEAPLKARAEGKPWGWCSIQSPPELFYAMDVPPFYYEHWSMVCASQKQAIPFMEACDEIHIKDLCSVHKVYNGAMQLGVLPKPTFGISVTYPCDAVLFGAEIAACPSKHNPCVCKADGCFGGYNGIPMFQIDGPYYKNETTLDYMVEEIKGSIAFMERVLGKPFNYNKLEEMVNLSNETFAIIGENNRLAASVPCPRRGRDLMRDPFVLVGTQQGLDFWKAANKEMKEMVAQGKGAIPNERIRLAWLNTPPYGFMGFLDQMEKEFGATVIWNNLSGGYAGQAEEGEPMYEIYPGDYMRTLASKLLSHYGPACYKEPKLYLQKLIRAVRNYKLDGVVASVHWGCKNFDAILKYIREELYEATGVPLLVLESDCLDERPGTIDRLVALTREFVEMLDQRK